MSASGSSKAATANRPLAAVHDGEHRVADRNQETHDLSEGDFHYFSVALSGRPLGGLIAATGCGMPALSISKTNFSKPTSPLHFTESRTSQPVQTGGSTG